MWLRSPTESTQRARKARSARGFTLLEALVSLAILAVVMAVLLSLLFSLKSFAARQTARTVPRQAARRAVDTLSPYLQGATDLNAAGGHPNALVIYAEWGDATATVRRQATYDNLTGSERGNATFVVNPSAPSAQRVTSSKFGTLGTDIVTLAVATTPIRIPLVGWGGNDPLVSTAFATYRGGCGVLDSHGHRSYTPEDDKANLSAFKKAVGAGPEPVNGKDVSGLLIIADGAGRWRYLVIDRFISSKCEDERGEVIRFGFTEARSPQLHPPGGFRSDFDPSTAALIAGIDFISFRHRTVLDTSDPTKTVGQIEEKRSGFLSSGAFEAGIFDPDVDGASGSLFSPILDGVSDLQVAWIFRDGSTWNDALGHVLPPAQNMVPLQGRTGEAVDCTGTPLSGAGLDVACVVGLRLGVVGEHPLPFESRDSTAQGLHFRPAAANRPAGPPDSAGGGIYERYKVTATLLLRNRAPGI